MTIPGETIATGAPTQCNQCKTNVKLMICKSFAGYYVGTMCDCGPYSRESDYYETRELAEKDLNNGTYSRK